MAVSKIEIQTKYPLPAYNYRVTILAGNAPGIASQAAAAKTPAGGKVISCSEVSGLNMEIDTLTYKDGLSFQTGFNVVPTQGKEIRFSIKKGITAHGPYFTHWMELVYPRVQRDKPAKKRDVLIDLCNEIGLPIVRWNVTKAMPTKLEAPTFDANTNEMAFERIEFVAHQLHVDFISL